MEPGKDAYTWLPYKHIRHIRSAIAPFRKEDFVVSIVMGETESKVRLKIVPTKNARQDVKYIYRSWIGEDNYERLKAYFKELGLLVTLS